VATWAGLPGDRAEAMRRIGMADFSAAGWRRPGTRFAAAYQAAVAAGDRRSQAWSLQNLAWVTTTRGDFAGADAALARQRGCSPSCTTRWGAPGCAAPPRSPGAGRPALPRPAAGSDLPAVR
jgi:hypothetical protein